MIDLLGFLPRAIVQGVPLLFGSTGETLTEKSGNLNLGIPGIMYVGAISGVIGAFYYEAGKSAQEMNAFLTILIPLLCCLLGSLLMGLLYCFLTVTLRANQNVTGLALTTFGVGFGNFFGGSLIKLVDSDVPSIVLSNTNRFFAATLPFAKNAGALGRVFFSYGWLAYAAVIIAIIASYILNRTRTGLHLRAVGENPKPILAKDFPAFSRTLTVFPVISTCLVEAGGAVDLVVAVVGLVVAVVVIVAASSVLLAALFSFS